MKYILITAMISVGVIAAGSFYCYNYYQFWNHIKTDHFQTLAEYEGEHIRGFRGEQILVNKDFIDELQLVDQYAGETDVELIVNQSFRVVNPKRGTVVRPVDNSNHKVGFAIDFNIKYNGKKFKSEEVRRQNLSSLPPNVQTFFQKVRSNKNIRWGGEFNKEDPVHIDQPINLINRNYWAEQKERCMADYMQAEKKWKFWK